MKTITEYKLKRLLILAKSHTEAWAIRTQNFKNISDSDFLFSYIEQTPQGFAYFENLAATQNTPQIQSSDKSTLSIDLQLSNLLFNLRKDKLLIVPKENPQAKYPMAVLNLSKPTNATYNNKIVSTDDIKQAWESFYPSLTSGDIHFVVVTPSYNHEKYIEQTMNSILSQRYQDFSYIVADGASKDSTVSILKKHESSLQWLSEKDSGYAEAVNRGFKLAKDITGKKLYGLWIPSDDLLFDEYSLSRLAKTIAATSADVIYGESFYFNDQGELLHSYPTEDYNFEKLKNNCYICQPSVAFSKDLFSKVEGLDISLRSIADYDLWLKFAQAGAKFQKFNTPISLYRLQDNSITVSQRLLTYKEIFQNQLKRFNLVHSNWIYGAIHELVSPTAGPAAVATSGALAAPSAKVKIKQLIKKVAKKIFFTSGFVGLALKRKSLQIAILRVIEFKLAKAKRAV